MSRQIRISLCSVPTDSMDPDLAFIARSKAGVPPKIGIVALVKWMEKNGYDSSCYDYYDIDMCVPDDAELADYFREYRPGVIGLSAVTSSTYLHVKRIAKIAREVVPEAWIVVGGNMAASANVILHKTAADVCVVGDGEICWVNLLKYIEDKKLEKDFDGLSSIQGLAYLDEQGQLAFTGNGPKISSEDFIYIPDYELLKTGLKNKPEMINNYFYDGRSFPFFSHDPRAHDRQRGSKCAFLWASKGCVARCSFCQRSTKGYRTVDVQRMDEHIVELKRTYDVGFVQVADENFGSDRNQAMQFAALMKKHDILWAATGIRCDSVTRDLIRFYRDNNCVGLKFGVESGSQKLLDLMEKKFSVEEVIEAHEWCKEAGIFFSLGMLVGMPGETEETILESAKMISEIAKGGGRSPAELMGYQAAYAIAFPGTPLYEYGQQTGVIGVDVDAEEKFLLRITSADTFKYFYVNLNGAPVKEVLNWEVLLMIEANRLYFLNTSLEKAETSPRLIQAETEATSHSGGAKAAGSIWRKVIGRLRRFDFSISLFNPWVSIFVKKYLIENRNAYRLPITLHRMLAKYLLYLEFLFVNLVAKAKGKGEMFAMIYPGGTRLPSTYIQKFPQRKLVSLRNVVTERRAPPSDLQEINRQKLLRGM